MKIRFTALVILAHLAGWNSSCRTTSGPSMTTNETQKSSLWETTTGPIPPQCLVRPWMSWDNFKEYRDFYKISNWHDFLENPGKYLGSEIKTLKPLTASWGNDTLVLAAPYTLCTQGSVSNGQIVAATSVEVTRKDDFITSERCAANEPCVRVDYEVLATIKPEACHRLAPDLQGTCHEALVVYLSEYSGGSIGPDRQAAIYGIFDIEDDTRYIVPLKYFRTRDDALAFARANPN